MSRIFVTGIGIISPIGNSSTENREALRLSRCGIEKARYLDSVYADLMPFGEVKLSNEDLKEKLKISQPGLTRTDLLALHALRSSIEDSGLSPEVIANKETAFINASTVGGMCLTDQMHSDANSKTTGSEFLNSYDCSSSTLFLQSLFGMNGVVNTINTACSSSANAISYGARLIEHGHAKRAIVGGCDSLAKFTVNGFNSLAILSKELCRPFDIDRKGLNLGEGAAYLVLEKEEDCRNKTIYTELTGYGNAADAFHASSLSEDGAGPFLSMKKALDKAKITGAEIDFINAHGTGTENNDLVESVAMKRIFEKVPLFASTKSNTGHTLGASGAIEAVYSIFNLHYQEIYPGLNFKHPIPETDLVPNKDLAAKKLKHVLSNSFAFGGNCTSLLFSKP